MHTKLGLVFPHTKFAATANNCFVSFLDFFYLLQKFIFNTQNFGHHMTLLCYYSVMFFSDDFKNSLAGFSQKASLDIELVCNVSEFTKKRGGASMCLQ